MTEDSATYADPLRWLEGPPIADEANLIDQALEHHQAGRLDEAATLYGRVLKAQPDNLPALHMLGIIAYQRGDDARALALLSRVLAQTDGLPEPHYHLGLVLLRKSELDRAAVHFGRALELAPQFAPAWHYLGLVHRRQGRQDEALACFERALENDPKNVRAAYELADALLIGGRIDRAVHVLEKALAACPNDAGLHGRLADAWHAAGKLDRAAAAYRQAVALAPGHVAAWWGLGCAETTRKEHASAAQSFERVIQREPAYGEARHNLGKALFELGQIDAALDSFRTAVALLDQPDLPLGMIATIIPGSPRADHRAVLEARQAWAARCAPSVPGNTTIPPSASSTRRLRVGYVCAFFQDPNWMKPVWGLVNHHDREQFELHLFSDAPASALRHGYTVDARDHFHDVSGLANAQLAGLIREQAIDVLVDLNGYSRLQRLATFALRPAPIQVAWFNMFATSGMSCFDGLIGDHDVFLDGEEAFYSERVVRLPRSYLTFEVTYPVPEVAPPPCLERGSITFGCLAPQYKVTPEVVEAWSTILRGCPRSRLVLKSVALASAANRDFVRQLFERFGIASERLDLDGPAEHFQFLEKYREIDLALDTFPYNGGTTTMEALWQGVPVLTFHGDRWASRISASLLRSAGLSEFVATDRNDYVARAIALAGAAETPARLDQLRRRMRDHLRQSRVCDTLAFAREMEQAYVHITGGEDRHP